MRPLVGYDRMVGHLPRTTSPEDWDTNVGRRPSQVRVSDHVRALGAGLLT